MGSPSGKNALFEAIGAVPDGVETLLGMRGDLLEAARGQRALAAVESDLFEVLAKEVRFVAPDDCLALGHVGEL